MAVGLHVRISRKYRQVLLLVEAGQGDGVEILCRTMYEAALAQAFICRQTVKLRRADRSSVNLHGVKLTQEFRAWLFLAHSLMRDEERLDKMDKVPGLRRLSAQERKLAQPVIDHAKAKVGPEWAKMLRKATTCAALPVSDLAYTMGDGLYRYYRTIYAMHSGHVHPGEHQRYVKRENGNTALLWQDELRLLELALCYSTAVAGLASREFARLLDTTHQPYVDARYFGDSYPELKKVFTRVFRR